MSRKPQPLRGRVALVTGAGRGIGAAVAKALASAGAAVALTDRLLDSRGVRPEGLDRMSEVALEAGLVRGEAVAEEIRAAGGQALTETMDVRESVEIDRAFNLVEDRWGSVDILVNNAAVFDHRAKFENQDPDIWRRDIEINLMGAMCCSRRAWGPMLEQGWGRVVMLSSAAGLMGSFGQASYSATKAALVGLAKSLALEGARRGVTANVVAPGPIRTDAFEMKTELGVDTSINERIVSATAMKRMGEPAEVASTVAFLASSEAGYLTGQVLQVNGGLDLFTF